MQTGPRQERDDAAAAQPQEQRRRRRHSYEGLVALVLRRPDGSRARPVVLRGEDLSAGGIAVLGSQMIPVGAEGVMQLVRQDGQFAIVGVRALHCRYMGGMEHRTGLAFVPLPEGFSREEFLDGEGRMKLLDPLLRVNCNRSGE